MTPETTPLSKRVEALLFLHGDPMAVGRLVEVLGANKTAIRAALADLDLRLSGGALRLAYHGDDVQLVTREHLAADTDALVADEHRRGLSRAAAETLAVVAYRGPVSKKDIDFIRGVNSAIALRNLLIRGLVVKRPLPHNNRAVCYEPTLDFLKFLGVGRVEELPEYAEFHKKIEAFILTDEAVQEL